MKNKIRIAVLLPVLIMVACTQAQIDNVLAWVNTAVQIAVAVAPAVGALQGYTVSGADVATVQSWAAGVNAIDAEIVSLVAQYKTGAAVLPQISADVQKISTDLATLLPALHVTDPTTVAKIQIVMVAATAALQIAVTALQQISPNTPPPAGFSTRAGKLPTQKQFKAEYNAKITATTGNVAVDAAFAKATVK